MSNLEDLYREVILDHYRTPRNKGELPPPATCTEGTNPLCGDEIKIFLNVADGIVQDVRFSGHGCSISQASASIMFDQINDLNYEHGENAVEHLVAMLQRTEDPNEDVLGDGIALVGVAQYPARVKCALLPWMAWKDAAIQAGMKKEK